MADSAQTQKELEAQRQKELDELFAEAIKQPKVPVGKKYLTVISLAAILTTLNAMQICQLIFPVDLLYRHSFAG